mgnify:FL=1
MLSCNVLVAHSAGDLEGEIRIFVEAEPGFCLAFRIVPDGGIFFGIFSHGLQLAEVGGYGLVLYDIYLPQAVYYRAVAASIVVVEPQDTLALGGDAYHVESHALADGGQVEHIAVGGEERQVMRFQEAPDTDCRVMDGSEQYGQIMGIFLTQFSKSLFFPLFLHGTAVGGKHGIVFFKTFYGEGVVANHSQLIEHLAQTRGMPPAGCSYVVYQLVVNEPACRQQFAYSFGCFRSDFEWGLEMCLDNELADADGRRLFLEFP